MEKTTKFSETRFEVETIESARKVFERLVRPAYQKAVFESGASRFASVDDVLVPEDLFESAGLNIWVDNTKWTLDTLDEFYTGLRGPLRLYQVTFQVSFDHRYAVSSSSWQQISESSVRTQQTGRDNTVTIVAPSHAAIATLSQPFERDARESRLEPKPVEADSLPRIFIGHGRSALWRDLKDHLHDQHHYQVVAYETGSRAGHTIRDVLDDMLSESTFAILVMTAEDEQADATLRSRQNVVHEAGLFQGRLGFSKTIILLEEGAEPFSNIDGVQYIPFAWGRIRETFGDVVATLRREFPSSWQQP